MTAMVLARYKSENGNELLVTSRDGYDYGHFETKAPTGAVVRVRAPSLMLAEIAETINKHSPPEPATVAEKWNALYGAGLSPFVYPSAEVWVGTLDNEREAGAYRVESSTADRAIEGLYRQAKENGWLR